MATTYRLHDWTFNVWEGPPPVLPVQHISTHTRAGATGTDHTALGLWGDPFTARLTAYYASHLLALNDNYRKVRLLPAAGLVQLTYAAIDYRRAYQVLFKVVAVEVKQCVSAVRVAGSGLNLPDAGILTIDCTLVAHGVS